METKTQPVTETNGRFTKTLHHPKPDYSKPPLVLPTEARKRMHEHLRFLYGKRKADIWMPELERILKVYYAYKPEKMIEDERRFDARERFTEKDIVLITYGDLIRGPEPTPLAALSKFCEKYLKVVNTLHILPFFPSSSDKGFSVVDFRSVDPSLGSWLEIGWLETRFQLMFDSVINHVSSEHMWFREFLDGHPRYSNYFISFSSPEELTMEHRGKIFRPRTSDILTRFETLNGPRYVWTTFSADQVDLNYKNPEVLLSVLELLLYYVRQGADIIRLDAVTYIWHEPGTSCVHLKRTHEVIRLFRTVLETVAPQVALVTETNVPHAENITYFGHGNDEAHMIYNFALPPLVLHAFYREDSTALSEWASRLRNPSNTATFFNFLDTHDGIGVMGAKNILPPDEIEFIIQRAEAHGALISYKTGQNGMEEPYEINTTWWSALNPDGGEDLSLQIRRFIASRSIALVLQGVPGIYLHGTLGTANIPEAGRALQSKRDINRQVIDSEALDREMDDPDSKLARVIRDHRKINRTRTRERAFHPQGPQTILTPSPKVFCVLRSSPERDRYVLALINVTDGTVEVRVPRSDLGTRAARWVDLLSGDEWTAGGDSLSGSLPAYGVVWLKAAAEED